jgi:hypothetical protein
MRLDVCAASIAMLGLRSRDHLFGGHAPPAAMSHGGIVPMQALSSEDMPR